MKNKIYLDDDRVHRNPPDDSWVHIYSFDEFVSYIEANGLPSVISFDHDLGNLDGVVLPTGKDCANWLVNYCLDHDLDLPEYYSHSGNSVGRANIIGLLDGYKKFRSFSI